MKHWTEYLTSEERAEYREVYRQRQECWRQAHEHSRTIKAYISRGTRRRHQEAIATGCSSAILPEMEQSERRCPVGYLPIVCSSPGRSS